MRAATPIRRVKPWRRTPAETAARAERRRQWGLWLLVAALVVPSALLGWFQPAGLERMIDIAYALLTPLLALQSAVETWLCLRARRWGMGLLMVAGTLVALGWWVVAWQRVL